MPGLDASLPPTARRESKLAGKALSSVVRHHDVVTAVVIAENQGTLVTGSRDGAVALWRIFTAPHERWAALLSAIDRGLSLSCHFGRNRPPLAASPYASFHVHSGRVFSVATNMHVGVVVSLARSAKVGSRSLAFRPLPSACVMHALCSVDAQSAAGDEVAIYSTRRLRYMRTLSFAPLVSLVSHDLQRAGYYLTLCLFRLWSLSRPRATR